jgi:hypothetical protein
MNQAETTLYGQLMTSLGDCLTPEVAGRIADLRTSVDLQERLQTLSELCTEGQLSAEEKSEYETYVHVLDFISLLQAKSRAILREMATP